MRTRRPAGATPGILLVAFASFASFASVAEEPAAVRLVTQEALLARQERHDRTLVVLDVRTPEEFAAGHIDGAINIPHDQLQSRLADVPRDKDIVVYCRTGRRSEIAARVLGSNGYTRVSHLEGDITAWVAQDRPLTRP